MSKVFITCGKCKGAGHIPTFGHYAGGVCFDCNGASGWWDTTEAIARRTAKIENDRKKEIKRQEKMKSLGDGDKLWAEFAMSYPAETMIALEYSPDPTGKSPIGQWDAIGTDHRHLHTAYTVVTASRETSQPDVAVRLIREYAQINGIEI